MEEINKPVITPDDIWCSNPPGASDRVEPNDQKKSKGFVYGEIPKHSMFNWYGNVFSQFCAHSCENGVPEWDSETTYTEGSMVLADNGSGERKLFIALGTTTGSTPSDLTDWREYYTNLVDLYDVQLTDEVNIPNGTTIVYDYISNTENPDYPVFNGYWRDIDEKSILSINDLIDVYGNDAPASMLVRIDTPEVGKAWAKRAFSTLTRYLYLGDWGDVSTKTPDGGIDADEGDILTYDGTTWIGANNEPFAEWDDIIFKPDTFRPRPTDQNTIGGFRATNKDPNTGTINSGELHLFSDPFGVPNKPRDLVASQNLPDKVTLTWSAPNDSTPSDPEDDPDNFLIFRDGVQIGSTPDASTLTYNDTSVPEMYKSYEYVVYASNSYGQSDPSNRAFGMVSDTPAEPLNFTATDSVSADYIEFNWSTVQQAEGYAIYQRHVGGAEADFEYIVGVLNPPYRYYTTPNQTFEFAVKAMNPSGESDYSNVDEGSTAANPGVKVFKTNGNFQIPNGVYEVELCLQGAGGSGGIGSRDGYHTGGGYAGQFIKKTIQVQPGQMFNINLGAGGAPMPPLTSLTDGEKGGDTIVTLPDASTITAQGGTGGRATSTAYAGNGKSIISECLRTDTGDGTYKLYDGLHMDGPISTSTYGGQASNFGHGGSRTGRIPGYGAGGSGISIYEASYDNSNICNGGDGLVTMAWGLDDYGVPLADEVSVTDSNMNYININPETDLVKAVQLTDTEMDYEIQTKKDQNGN